MKKQLTFPALLEEAIWEQVEKDGEQKDDIDEYDKAVKSLLD